VRGERKEGERKEKGGEIAAFSTTIWPSFNDYEQILVQPIELIKQGKGEREGEVKEERGKE
jgi:hypothetical protein